MTTVSPLTTTIEQVLDPIAAGISQLIIVCEEAEQGDVELPDLTPHAEIVVANTATFAKVGRDTSASTNDEILKRDMPSACELVEHSGKGLISAAQNMRDSPKDAAARYNLIESARGVLNGTARVLEVLDEKTVRTVVAMANVIYERMDIVAQITMLEEMVEVMKILSPELVRLATVSQNRVSELTSAELRDQLQTHVDIVRNSSDNLVVSLKSFVQNAGKASEANKNLAIDQLRKTSKEIIRLVQIKVFKEYNVNQLRISNRTTAIRAHLGTVANSITNPMYKERVAEYKNDVHAILTNADEVCETISCPEMRQNIRDTQDKIRQLQKDMVSAETALLTNPNDAAATERLAASANDLLAHFDLLQQQVNNALVNEISNAFVDIATPVSLLRATAANGDSVEYEKQSRDLGVQIQKLSKLSHMMALRCDDAEQSKAITKLANDVEKLVDTQILAGQTLLENPNDEAAIRHFDVVCNEWATKTVDLHNAIDDVNSSEDIIQNIEMSVLSDLETFKHACAIGNGDELAKSTGAIGGKVKHIVLLAQKEAENSDAPEYSEKINLATKKLENNLRTTIVDAKAAFSTPDDTTKQNKLSESVKGLASSILETKEAVRGRSIDDLDKLLDGIQVDEELLEYEPEPMPMPADPIAAAAHPVLLEANKWVESDNDLVRVAKGLSEKMALMSDLAKNPASKREMISLAKDIALNSQEVISISTELAKTCTDKRLKQALLLQAERIPTISTQLKIISGVKAANFNNDDADAQLITAAHNLMDAVMQTMKAAESAHIRSMKTTGTVAVGAIKWKKKLYKKI